MVSWVIWSFVLLGVLSIVLSLFRRTWRESASSPLSRRSHRPSSITDVMQAKHFQKLSSFSKRHGSIGGSFKRRATDRLRRVRRSQSGKLAGDRSSPNSLQPENPAVEQGRGDYSQKGKPAFKQSSRRYSRRPQPAARPPESAPPQPVDPAFEQTRIRRSRRAKSVNTQADFKPHQQPNLADEQTQMRSSRRAKPINHSLDS